MKKHFVYDMTVNLTFSVRLKNKGSLAESELSHAESNTRLSLLTQGAFNGLVFN